MSKTNDQPTVKDMDLTTHEIFDTMKWFCEMYQKLGEAKALNIKFFKDESNGETWDESKLNKHRKEFFKNSSIVISGNYKELDKRSKKTKRKVSKENKNPKPVVVSQNAIDFFNTVDLGKVEFRGHAVPIQEVVSGLHDSKHVMTNELLMKLFGIWIYYSDIKDSKNNVLQKGLQDKDKKSKVYANSTFAEHFEEEIEEMIKNPTLKNKPLKNETVEIQGTSFTPSYILPFPTFVVSICSKYCKPIEFKVESDDDQRKVENIYNRLREETDILSQYRDSLKNNS